VTRIVEAVLASSARSVGALPEPTLPEIAFAGRSNVGKSSLLNAITGRRRLFEVSRTPGRTRSVVHVEARLSGGGRIYLVDLPGYGYAKVSKAAKAAWGRLVEGYLSGRATLHLVALLVDVRRGVEEEEEELAGFLSEAGVPALLVATKIDRLVKGARRAALDALSREVESDVLGVSARTREGVDDLLARVAAAAGYGPAPRGEPGEVS